MEKGSRWREPFLVLKLDVNRPQALIARLVSPASMSPVDLILSLFDKP
jgi:hypothetical protein